jgi:hypothetical protein
MPPLHGRKIVLTKIAANLCQNNVKKIKLVHHLLLIKDAPKAIFVHPLLRKKIIQRCRRIRLDTLSAFSYGA